MINNIVLQGMKNDLTWEVIGITLCDYPVFFEPSIISWGIPDNWGSAAVVYALIEGLAGVKDNGIAFEKALLAPRWAASDVQNVTTTVKYEASGGYVSYNYSYETEDNLIKILYTGNADTINLKVMLPENTSAINLNVNGTQVPLSVLKIENSKYVEFTSLATGVYEAIIKLKRDYPTVPK